MQRIKLFTIGIAHFFDELLYKKYEYIQIILNIYKEKKNKFFVIIVPFATFNSRSPYYPLMTATLY